MNRGFRGIFRREAIDHHASGTAAHSDLLRLSPGWVRWTYPLVLGVAAVGLAFLLLGRTHVYATGPGVVRMAGRVDISAPVSAVVEEVRVEPGQRVRAGDVLIQLESAEQVAEFERVTRDFEVQLTSYLRDPLDDASRRSVASLRAEKEYKERLVEARRLRAPRDAVIDDVRVRAGQPLQLGQIAVTLRSGAPTLQLVAALPGAFRPQLESRQEAWLELQGYAHAHHRVVLRAVAPEVIGPNEARRFLGAEVADAVSLHGPVVIVQAGLTSDVFKADGETYALHDGMQGQLAVRVRSEPILMALLPGLRYFTERRRE